MHAEQRQRAHDVLRSRGIHRALFASRASVTWLTGFAPPVQLGPSPFAGGPPLVWYEDGAYTLVILDGYAADAAEFGRQPGCAVVTYLGYTIEQPIAGAAHLAAALRQTLSTSMIRTGAVGVEERETSSFILATLTDALGQGTQTVAIDGWLEPLRMVKTAEELDKLRHNFEHIEVGHAAARQAVWPGRREIDVWADIHSAVQTAAGHRVPLGNDCVVGSRQANIGGWPLDLEIKPHDSFIVDLSTLHHGYWSDSCATYYAGEPTTRQVAMHRTAEEALQLAIALIRPGVMARDIDRQVRQFIADCGYPVYPHHTGHSVGVTGHEAPRIVPYNTELIEPGMVLLVEPGIYFPGETGVRLEDAVLVTATGCEVLTHHDKSLAR